MSRLPPGFQFFPSDEELVVHFLYRKASFLPCQPDVIPSLNLHHLDPWDLNGKALEGGGRWYFFSHRTHERVSPNGYWIPVGTDEPIASGDKDVGTKKTLVFYLGEAPEGVKTKWVMHEYHLLDCVINANSSSNGSRRSSRKRGHPRTDSNNWVICRIFEADCGPLESFFDNETELSCMDEVFLSLDDLDEIGFPN